jgi:hypothetical protein
MMQSTSPTYQEFLLDLEKNQISDSNYLWFETSVQSIIQSKLLSKNDDMSIKNFIEIFCAQISDSICKIQINGAVNQNISKLFLLLMDLMTIFIFEYYPIFLNKMLSIIIKTDHPFFQIFIQSSKEESSHSNQLLSECCSKINNQKFMKSVFEFLQKEKASHLYTLFYLHHLNSTFCSILDQEYHELISQTIELSLINIYQSQNENILNDQELFQKVLQSFSKQDNIRRAILQYLFDQMPKNISQVLNDIKFILTLDVEKESAVKFLSILGFFNELLKIKLFFV